MKTFIIQTFKNEIVYDFTLEIKEAIKYHNWFYNCNDFEYKLIDNINEIYIDKNRLDDYIPVGSIDFVLDFYKQFHNIEIKPINIPKELLVPKFLQRNVVVNEEISTLNLNDNDKVFIKSKNKFKDITDIVKIKDISQNKELIISELIEIESEWRCFIFRNNILGIKNYQGEFLNVSNIDVIKDMINTYNKPNKAYTLDVGVVKGKTLLIEVHDFFSCGLYGFNDYRYILNMTIATHREILQNKQ